MGHKRGAGENDQILRPHDSLELHLPIEHIASEQVVVRQKLLDDEHTLVMGT